MPRRTRIATALTGVATAGLLVALVPGSASGQATAAESAENAPAACKNRPNDTLQDLLECVTVNGVRSHLEAFQRIADNNGGTRASGTPGFDRSVELCGQEAAGMPAIHASVQRFDFPFFEELSPPVFEQTAPTARAFVQDTDFATMDFSGSGEVDRADHRGRSAAAPGGWVDERMRSIGLRRVPGRQRGADPAWHVRLRGQGRQRRGCRRLSGDHLQRGQHRSRSHRAPLRDSRRARCDDPRHRHDLRPGR